MDKGCRIGRNYQAFQEYLDKNPDTSIVQKDRVIGSVGGKCLLTIHFVESSLMLAFLRDTNTSQSVIDIFDDLQEKLGMETFHRLFPLILTDSGSEFSNPAAIEVNHKLIRRVLTGVNGRNRSFNNLKQDDVTLMMDHINSYKRKKLNDRRPHETFSFYHVEEVLKLLECSKVAADDIQLKPELLGI